MVGYVLTVLGIAGTIVSLVIEQSDYDPVAFGVATVSILVAIVGLSLALKIPAREQTSDSSCILGAVNIQLGQINQLLKTSGPG